MYSNIGLCKGEHHRLESSSQPESPFECCRPERKQLYLMSGGVVFLLIGDLKVITKKLKPSVVTHAYSSCSWGESMGIWNHDWSSGPV